MAWACVEWVLFFMHAFRRVSASSLRAASAMLGVARREKWDVDRESGPVRSAEIASCHHRRWSASQSTEGLNAREEAAQAMEWQNLVSQMDSGAVEALQDALDRRRARLVLDAAQESTDASGAASSDAVIKAFLDADTNRDGVIERREFQEWYLRRGHRAHQPREDVSKPSAENTLTAPVQPSSRQLWLLALHSGLPFIGFGFVDNAIMLIAGESIDFYLGTAMNLSTMAAAGLGNLVSDVFGVGLGSSIEAFTSRLGIPPSKLTLAQRELRVCRVVSAGSGMVAITIGCLLGMLPLLFMRDTKNKLRLAFNALDRDGSGTLSLEEVTAALRSAGIEPNDDDVRALLSAADGDADGQINFDEFCTLAKSLEAQLHSLASK